MRLIDADKLKRHYAWWEDDKQRLFDSIVDVQPTIDAVPVIRCRDCKYCETMTIFGKDFPACTRSKPAVDVRMDDYCSQAERKEK